MTTEIKKTEKELLDHVADLEIQIKKLKDRKRYGLVWEEKIEKFDKESKEALPILIEKGNKYSDIVTDKDKDFNILIEGDNYHSLSILSYTHKNKIDVIYIDPPYNTGNKDFIYNDHFVDKEDGFRHSKWLSFLNKRLKIAKNLLTKDGVIFISIDDNEQANLKLLCDSVFGENSFVALFPWKKRTTKSDVPFGVSQDYEWVICYAKSSFLAGMSHERKYYKTDDYPNDRWRLSDLTTQKVEKDRPNSAFNLVNPKNGKIYPYNPNRLWAITKDTFEDYYKKGKIVFPEDYDFLKISIPSYRVFESEDKKKALKKYGSDTALKSVSTHFPKDIGMNEDGNEEITNLFGEKIFSYPKPKNLIKYLLDISTNSNSLILDFMAGSGTTGHAVLELNKDDGGSRRFILCTNNGDEKSEHKIAEDICYPRLKKIIKGYIRLVR